MMVPSPRWRVGPSGTLDRTELGFDPAEALIEGTHRTLARCSHTIRLRLGPGGALPPKPALTTCRHRKLKLLFTVRHRSTLLCGASLARLPAPGSCICGQLYKTPKMLSLLRFLVGLDGRCADGTRT